MIGWISTTTGAAAGADGPATAPMERRAGILARVLAYLVESIVRPMSCVAVPLQEERSKSAPKRMKTDQVVAEPAGRRRGGRVAGAICEEVLCEERFANPSFEQGRKRGPRWTGTKECEANSRLWLVREGKMQQLPICALFLSWLPIFILFLFLFLASFCLPSGRATRNRATSKREFVQRAGALAACGRVSNQPDSVGSAGPVRHLQHQHSYILASPALKNKCRSTACRM